MMDQTNQGKIRKSNTYGAAGLSQICLIAFTFLCTAQSGLAAAAPTPPSPAAANLLAPCSFPDFDDAVERFSKVLTFKTTSDAKSKDHVLLPDEHAALHAYLQSAYPQVWEQLTVEKVGDGGYSYLITWPGSNPSLNPALLIGHTDVVPVDSGTEQDWTYPPFSGTVADGFIWGRGALDLKVVVVGWLEAAAALLREGTYHPERTLLLAFGHDEEVSGFAGAGKIAAKLAAEGRRLEFVWDEGGFIYYRGLRPFTDLPVALVATAEKFYQSVNVTLMAAGGHSAVPPIDRSSVSARLADFLSAFTASPPATRLVSPTREFLEGLTELAAPGLALILRLIKLLPRAWADKLVAHAMAQTAPTASLVRDTASVTLVQAGVADNVLPPTAQLSINFRLLPGTPVSDTLRHVQRWLGPTANASVVLFPTAFAPSSVTDDKGPAFQQVIRAAIQEGWTYSAAAGPKHAGNGVPVLPYLMPAGSDSKHYQNLTDTILRFSPYLLTPQSVNWIHGTDERLSVQDFQRALCTFRAGLRLAGQAFV